MTTTRAAIDGEYADFKIIRTRSCCQMVIELPLEHGDELIRLFGVPQPGKPKRVAVALLADAPQIEAKAEPAPTNGNGHRSWRDLTPAQQAGIRCTEPSFQKFLREKGESEVSDEDGAANYVRLACGVHSRAELTTKSKARILWNDLEQQFQRWMTTPEFAP